MHISRIIEQQHNKIKKELMLGQIWNYTNRLKEVKAENIYQWKFLAVIKDYFSFYHSKDKYLICPFNILCHFSLWNINVKMSNEKIWNFHADRFFLLIHIQVIHASKVLRHKKVFKVYEDFHSPTFTQTGHKLHWTLSIFIEMNELQINL